jgi:D-glycero-D-manno-heptose 1,7-bisphosphate phosphatase
MAQRDNLFDRLLAPLPGTSQAKRALFVDRFGTLLIEPSGAPKTTYKEQVFTPGALDSLFRCTQAGWAIYLIGNEDAVARGQCKDSTWVEYEEQLITEMRGHGIPVARSYACLDHPTEGKGNHQKDSVFLLPNTGAMYHARQHDGIRLEESWVIGDSSLELTAGWRAGCRTAGIETTPGVPVSDLELEVEFCATSLSEVLDEILHLAETARS